MTGTLHDAICSHTHNCSRVLGGRACISGRAFFHVSTFHDPREQHAINCGSHPCPSHFGEGGLTFCSHRPVVAYDALVVELIWPPLRRTSLSLHQPVAVCILGSTVSHRLNSQHKVSALFSRLPAPPIESLVVELLCVPLCRNQLG